MAVVWPVASPAASDGPATGGDWAEDRPRNWLGLVNEAMNKKDLQTLQACAQRGQPYGAADWVAATALRLGLGFTLRPPGRPRRLQRNE
jgi:hypothetical protein